MRATTKLLPAVDLESQSAGAWAIGTLVGITAAGSALVALTAGGEPIEVCTTLQIDDAEDLEGLTGAKVLLCLTDARTPILIGFVHDALVPREATASHETTGSPETATSHETATRTTIARIERGQQSVEARVDGRAVTIDAEREIVLRCGKSMLLLRHDGTIVLRGVKITSRASRSQKIRGASVNIN